VVFEADALAVNMMATVSPRATRDFHFVPPLRLVDITGWLIVIARSCGKHEIAIATASSAS
jgi:hypothetical protein